MGVSSSYYVVAGVPLDREMERLRRLPIFSDGPLAKRRPDLRIRRASRKPNRLGFAVPREFRLSVTAYPEIRVGDVLETLVHELTHLHVGRADEARAWHGSTFKHALGEAMHEAYGLMIPVPRNTRHGVYAEAIEHAEGKASRPMQTSTNATF
ncbi:MAG TPA: hypothetical protein VG458_06510 [Solirubrobacterales bacterium]|nr:hypothetical protein [Solirubrobacterales bacterium]